MKFFVVPESSERWTGVMAVEGSSASGLASAMAGSSQVVMVSAKMPAMTSGVRFSSSTPSRLKMTATGETYRGSSMTSSLAQTSPTVASSSSSR